MTPVLQLIDRVLSLITSDDYEADQQRVVACLFSLPIEVIPDNLCDGQITVIVLAIRGCALVELRLFEDLGKLPPVPPALIAHIHFWFPPDGVDDDVFVVAAAASRSFPELAHRVDTTIDRVTLRWAKLLLDGRELHHLALPVHPRSGDDLVLTSSGNGGSFLDERGHRWIRWTFPEETVLPDCRQCGRDALLGYAKIVDDTPNEFVCGACVRVHRLPQEI